MQAGICFPIVSLDNYATFFGKVSEQRLRAVHLHQIYKTAESSLGPARRKLAPSEAALVGVAYITGVVCDIARDKISWALTNPIEADSSILQHLGVKYVEVC